ncbi:MAG: D-alanyl-D-alanine carboxypeptidase [Acidimicrobiaceae bacterium]|nr:D-alanyl-D-alanine carboxypeptidase [Acidimicrobiaceae bacterium]
MSSYSRGNHYRDSRSSFAGFSRVIVVLVILIVVVSAVQLLRPTPLPTAHASIGDAVIPGTPPSLPWPSQGGGEVMIQNVGIIGSFNAGTELPLASVAKIITALVIVKDHPLVLGGTGPTLTMTASDVATYQTMVQQQDSVMGVVNGENLNEYQLLEALLVPSADNIAIKLADWDAGSVPAFVAKMNSMAKSLGMTKTIFKDPSGLDSGTVGTAHDQVLAALALLKNPVLAQIVAKPQASLPVAGVVYNVNYNVGHDGFVGVKTGSMGSGGNLVFAATGAASKDLIVGAVLDQTGVQPLIAALSESTKLVDAARKIPAEFSVLKKGQVVASISVPGRRSVTVESAGGASFLGWPGMKVTYVAKFSKLSHKIPIGTRVGSLTVTVGSQTSTVSLVTTSAVQSPSMMWRLERL